MQMSDVMKRIVATALLLGFTAGTPALALDPETVIQKDRSPWAMFRFGFSAYKSGKKQEAVEAYRYAAEKGQVGARWKLARMYAEGDGVPRNDYEAFKFFSSVAQQNIEPGSQDESYISDALVALGRYLRKGIENSPIRPNPHAAQEFFMRAAAVYRNANAQYELGLMFLEGDTGTQNVQQAARWLQLAAEKNHAPAQATLGHLLFQRGQTVEGLALMTTALEGAAPSDIPWIRARQEEAFALAGESDRRTAMARAEHYLVNGID